MSPRMVRMLKFLAGHGVDESMLRRANQLTLRGLAMRGYVSRSGITQSGVEALSEYQRSEFIARKAENKPLSDGVLVALQLVRKRRPK